jgi:ubiquinone/menaquinone biosynthesis C-methylase UbiE
MDGKSWTRYWRAGALNASTMEFTTDAQKRIANRWAGVFSALPSGSTILDIGTGVGALVAMAAQTTNADHLLSATGIDLADLEPDRMTTVASTDFCQIALQGGVSADSLPFEDRSFTTVTSQFAIEYSDFEKALAEVCRVSSQRFVALIHAREGVVVRQNGPIAEQVQWLTDDLKLVDLLAAHVKNPTDETAECLTNVAAQMKEKLPSLENPSFLHGLSLNIGKYLQQHERYTAEQNQELLGEFKEQLESQAKIISALIAAAKTADEMEQARSQLSDGGFGWVKVEEQRSNDDRHLVGYWLMAERQA